MIRLWLHVVLIDTTYKTNHNFLVAFCLMRDKASVSYGRVQTPDVIVMDRDKGLSAAISVVFPGEQVFIINYRHSVYICLT